MSVEAFLLPLGEEKEYGLCMISVCQSWSYLKESMSQGGWGYLPSLNGDKNQLVSHYRGEEAITEKAQKVNAKLIIHHCFLKTVVKEALQLCEGKLINSIQH